MEIQPDVLYQLLQADLALKEPLPYTSDLTVKDARKSSLLASIFKKWEPEDATSLEQKAIDGFMSCNAYCSTVTLPTEGFVYEAMKIAKQDIAALYTSGPNQFQLFDLHDFCGAGKCGPGASIGTKRTDFLGKMFESDLCVTEMGLYRFYESQLSPSWQAADNLRAANRGVKLSRGSRLSTVPKNRETNRTICTEPSLNMYFQLGAGECLERMLKKGHNIDLSTQPNKNKYLARTGSVNGEFATIDLKSASDTISTKLVEWLLPRELFSLLDLVRSKEVKVGKEWHKLHMFSSMGNGFTFPLQTLIFAALVRASYKVLGLSPRTKWMSCNYSVFGDDIICVKSAYNFVCQVLNGCGFHVNDTKSFNVGPFRESCGGDYFKGFDIRAVYLRRSHGTHDIYSAFNRLVRWSAKYGIRLCRVLLYLKGLADVRPVPFDEQDTAGFKIPSAYLRARKSDRNGATYYTSLCVVPRFLRIGARLNRKLHGPSPNPDGINPVGTMLCAIGGYVRDHQIGIRDTNPKWKVIRCKTPCWDYVTSAGLTIRDYEFALNGVFE